MASTHGPSFENIRIRDMNTAKNIRTTEHSEIVNRLHFLSNLYESAAERIHNKPMMERLQNLQLHRKNAMAKMAHRLGIPFRVISLRGADWLRLQRHKFGMWVRHIYVRRNEREVLNHVLEEEGRLLSAMRKLIATPELKAEKKEILANELYSSERVYQELYNYKEGYNFPRMAG